MTIKTTYMKNWCLFFFILTLKKNDFKKELCLKIDFIERKEM